MIISEPKTYKVSFIGNTKPEYIEATRFDIEKSQSGTSWIVFCCLYRDDPSMTEVARFKEFSLKGIVALPHRKRKKRKEKK